MLESKDEKIREGFSKCKNEISSLKQSSDDWIRFLCQQNDFLKERLEKLEIKVRELELERDMHNYGDQ